MVRAPCSHSGRIRRRLDGVDVIGFGERPVWALQVRVLRELTQHAGHAEILREQILATRPS